MQKRIELLDAWRSLCVVLMIFYHAAFDLSLFGAVPESVISGAFFETLKYLVSGGFILVSGAVSRYSRSCVRRGFYVFCWGLAVSVVMAAMSMPVAFGILQLIGVSMVICGLLGPGLYRAAERPWFPIACALGFAVCAAVLPRITVGARWLYPLGLRHDGFYSADYYPLLPWVMLYLLGVWLGGVIEKRRSSPLLSAHFPRPVTFLGRHSLAVYIVHQPVLYGLCLLIFGGK